MAFKCVCVRRLYDYDMPKRLCLNRFQLHCGQSSMTNKYRFNALHSILGLSLKCHFILDDSCCHLTSFDVDFLWIPQDSYITRDGVSMMCTIGWFLPNPFRAREWSMLEMKLFDIYYFRLPSSYRMTGPSMTTITASQSPSRQSIFSINLAATSPNTHRHIRTQVSVNGGLVFHAESWLAG